MQLTVFQILSDLKRCDQQADKITEEDKKHILKHRSLIAFDLILEYIHNKPDRIEEDVDIDLKDKKLIDLMMRIQKNISDIN